MTKKRSQAFGANSRMGRGHQHTSAVAAGQHRPNRNQAVDRALRGPPDGRHTLSRRPAFHSESCAAMLPPAHIKERKWKKTAHVFDRDVEHRKMPHSLLVNLH